MTALAWTLVHFLWQGTLIAAAAALLLRRESLTASSRYLIGVGALFVMLAAPLATYVVEVRREATRSARSFADRAAILPLPSTMPDGSTKRTAEAAPVDQAPRTGAAYVVLPWAAGVIVLLIRLLGGWVVASTVARRVLQPAGPDVQAMVTRLSGRLALERAVRVFESAAVVVPVVIGWVRPVVLVPTAALAGLPPAQLEALLAHELAHVRRHDYLVNLLQAVVETLLFYHPAVWWVSRQVRAEREHCCDDIAVSVCDRVEYVSALSALAAISAPPRLALAATDGRLVSRVRRLLRREPAEQGAASVWLSAAVAITLVVSIPAAMAALDWREGRVEPRANRAEGVSAAPGIQSGSVSELPAPVETRASEATPVEDQRFAALAATATPDMKRTTETDQAAARKPVETEVNETLERYRQALAEEERKLADYRKRQEQLEVERMRDEFNSQRAELRSRLESSKQALADAKMKFEVGVVSSDVPASYQTQIQSLERELAALERKRTHEQQLFRLTAEQAAAMRNYDLAAQQLAAQQYAEVLARREQQKVEERIDTNQQANEVQLQRQAQERVAAAGTNLRERVASAQGASEQTRAIEAERDQRQLAAMEQLRSQLLQKDVVADPAATVRVGDTVTVEIHGETDVPTSYVIAAAGTIRLPFMEPVKVVGLTRAQVEAALVKQLQRVVKDVALEVGIRRTLTSR
jgi:beta-lactamase regulating signal transducer with metallopeptidase domain